MNFRQMVLRMISPETERCRMEMRAARQIAEASAEDLSRTMTLRSDEIAAAIRQSVCEKGGIKP